MGKTNLKYSTSFPRIDQVNDRVYRKMAEAGLQRGSSVNLLHILTTPFPKNTSGGLLLGSASKKPRSFPLMISSVNTIFIFCVM